MSGPILYFSHPCLPGTVSATEKLAVGLGAMSDDLTVAVITNWRKLMNRAFEPVKRMKITHCYSFERQMRNQFGSATVNSRDLIPQSGSALQPNVGA